MRSGDPVHRLVAVAVVAAVLIAVGVPVALLVTPVAWVLVVLGVFLVALGPMLIAWAASPKPDHKVEGRTFVVDLFRSVGSADRQEKRRGASSDRTGSG
jgi:protein-S-isoprenylcysteine O-methyltransferase Ste14